MIEYKQFLESKKFTFDPVGFDPIFMPDMLFEWQKDVVTVAIKRGRFCLFTDTGTGKSFMQSVYAENVHRHTNKPVLILAPLAVTEQTKEEAAKLGINIKVCRAQNDAINGINITNYDMIDKFNPSYFAGIVLDESSILKHFTSKTRNQIIEFFEKTQYKLACSATPSPNDYMELGNHSEFMGVMTRTEMLATFFYHDGGETSKWILKGHARNDFWAWISEWAIAIRKPSEIGYSDDGYNLPPLNIEEIIVKSESGIDEYGQQMLVPSLASTLSERRTARRDSLEDRCQTAAELMHNAPDDQWLFWCDLNAESEMLTKLTGGCEVKGSDDREYKSKTLLGFSHGEVKTLVSKPSIAGFGMNWQSCHNMVFVGLSDSYESMYQAIRRCYRFGQKNPVNVYIITSESEGAVRENIARKEKQTEQVFSELAKYSKATIEKEVRKTYRKTDSYEAIYKMEVPQWLMSA